MIITRSWLRNRLRERLDERSPGGLYTDEQLNANLLIAYFKIAGKTKNISAHQDITMREGVYVYPLSSRMFDGSSIALVTFDDDSQPIDRVSFAEFVNSHDLSVSVSGTPEQWSYFGREIFLYPVTADLDIKVRFWVTEPSWKSDNSDTRLPRNLIDPLINYAVVLSLLADEEEERAKVPLSMFYSDIRDMVEHQSDDADDFEHVRDVDNE